MATVTHPYIVGDASVCGGSPRINGTRITVRTVVIATLLHGQTPEQLLQHYPHLPLPLSFCFRMGYSDLGVNRKRMEQVRVLVSGKL